jgi:hypothetical protein
MHLSHVFLNTFKFFVCFEVFENLKIVLQWLVLNHGVLTVTHPAGLLL